MVSEGEGLSPEVVSHHGYHCVFLVSHHGDCCVFYQRRSLIMGTTVSFWSLITGTAVSFTRSGLSSWVPLYFNVPTLSLHCPIGNSVSELGKSPWKFRVSELGKSQWKFGVSEPGKSQWRTQACHPCLSSQLVSHIASQKPANRTLSCSLQATLSPHALQQ